MSGGSFNYVCHDVTDASQIFSKLYEVQRVEEWLRDNQKHDAADEVLLYLREMQTHERRVEAIGRRIENLLHAVEWTASGDTNIESVDIAWAKLMGLANDHLTMKP